MNIVLTIAVIVVPCLFLLLLMIWEEQRILNGSKKDQRIDKIRNLEIECGLDPWYDGEWYV